MRINQTIGNPGNPCWDVEIVCDDENVCVRFKDLDSNESIGVAFSPSELLEFIDAIKLMFKIQQNL